ncbi:MAG: glycosyltransferase [Bacillota bacterium]
MKIAFFTDSFREDLGGLTRAVIALHDRLTRAGHQVRVFTLPQTGGPIHPGDVGFVRAIPLRGVPGLPPDSHLAWDYWQVRRDLAAWRPHIVHLHTMLPVGWLGLLAARSLGIPAVATYHANVRAVGAVLAPAPGSGAGGPALTGGGRGAAATVARGQAGGWSAAAVAGRAVAAAARQALAGAAGRAAGSLVPAFYNRCEAVIAPSRFAAAELRQMGVRRPIAVISNGVDLDRFAPAAEAREDRGAGVTVLFVGRLSPEKGVDWLARTLQMVLAAEPTLRARVVGDGPLAPALRQALAPWLAGGRVALRGHVPWERMPAEYAAGDIFLFPSPSETQGLAVLEAMSAGLPVVAVRAGALPELVRDGESGITAPPGDVEALARGVLRLARDPGLRRRLGEGARAVAAEHGASQALAEVLALYARVTASGAGGRTPGADRRAADAGHAAPGAGQRERGSHTTEPEGVEPRAAG